MSGMDMSGMSMSSMNMSSMSNMTTNMSSALSSSSDMNGMSMMSDNMCMVMLNGFQFSLGHASNCIVFLFPFSQINTQAKYAGAVIGTFLICFAFELFRAGRERMIKQKAPFGFLQQQTELTMDMLKAGTYGVQVWIGYWIMLLVMTYEAFIFIAIVIGLSTGYFMVLRVNRVMDRQGSSDKLSTSNTVNGADSDEDAAYSPATPCCSKP
jgi:F0F1-type ATP synthase assembly protein I